jgi:NADP-dependent 3-hydroxy acid dehydrogenase YdfG
MHRHVVVAGATGGIGSSIAAAAMAAGYSVVAIGRREEALRELASRAGPDGLIALQGSFETEAQAAAAAAGLRALRVRIDGVVAVIGAPLASGRLLERDAAALAERLAQDVLPHFLVAKHLLPLVAARSRGTSYLVLGCAAADFPWAGYGHVSIGAAARRMLVQVLREECKDLPVRIQLLQVEGPVCTHRNARTACPAWVSAEAVGREAVELLRHSDGQAGVVHLRAGGRSIAKGESS